MAREIGQRAEEVRLLGPAFVEAALPPLGVAAEKRDVMFKRQRHLLALLHLARGGDAFPAQKIQLARGVGASRRGYARNGGG
jgi:hypothetical protein